MKIIIILLAISSMFYAKDYKNGKCIMPKKWISTESEDCLYFMAYNDNKKYCIYMEQIGLDRNIADVVDNAMKTKKPILVANDNFGIGIKVVSKNCK